MIIYSKNSEFGHILSLRLGKIGPLFASKTPKSDSNQYFSLQFRKPETLGSCLMSEFLKAGISRVLAIIRHVPEDNLSILEVHRYEGEKYHQSLKPGQSQSALSPFNRLFFH